MTEVAKSKDTIVWTDSTSGVLKPARTSERATCRCQCLADPVQPNDSTPYMNLRHFSFARSRTDARSGNRPEYQKSTETVKYVDIANTSQSRGELKFGHTGPRVFG